MDEAYLLSLRTTLLDCAHMRIHVDDVITELKRFESKLRASKPIQDIIDKHMTLLSAIKFEIQHLITEPHVATKKQELIRCRDKLFGSLLRSVTYTNEKTRVTKLYNEFMKGITYFTNQTPYEQTQPVYHRPGSCSKKGNKNDDCTNVGNTNVARTTKKESIRICYIERLVYDNLWTRLIFSSQDIEHIKWLEQTKQAYQSCYPDSQIFVDIELVPVHNIPIQLCIYENDNQEIYEKRYDISTQSYIYPVDCIRYEASSTKRKQTFEDAPKQWL